MRYGTGGQDTPAFNLVNSIPCMSTAVAEGRKYVRGCLKNCLAVSGLAAYAWHVHVLFNKVQAIPVYNRYLDSPET